MKTLRMPKRFRREMRPELEDLFLMPPEMVEQYRISGLQNDEIYCIGEVTDAMEKYVREGLLFIEARHSRSEERPEVSVVISSPGGSEPAGLAIHDLLMLYGRHMDITGIVVGKAFSAASMFILQGCTLRAATENSSIMCHNGMWIMSFTRKDFEDPEWQAKIRRGFERSDKLTINILKKRTGRTEAEILELLKQEEFLSAQEAKDFGLIDVIWTFEVKKRPTEKAPRVRKPTPVAKQ